MEENLKKNKKMEDEVNKIKMEDDLQKKLKTTRKNVEDDLKKWKMTSKTKQKNGRQPLNFLFLLNGRRTKKK